ncbi:protein FAM216A-like [Myripristis murdjan]|uniref:protein FAM216A-like n=1 Tax=Myripristis murdjan TaxID=586833 RepID=UPI001176171C|nr:protein FAM216A-like [Myripristis murdjan]
MKKQVTFAENQNMHRAHHREALQRCETTYMSKTELPASRHEPKLQGVVTVHIPKTVTAGPFLKHAELSPAQREFLYTVAASCSGERVRSLITRHYLNVLHRSAAAGFGVDRDDVFVIPDVQTGEEHDEREKHDSELPNWTKQTNSGAKNPGKSLLPKIPTGQIRSNTTSTPKIKKSKKHTTRVPSLKRSPPRWRTKLLEEEEEDEPDESMSECMSSLSMGDDDNDTLTDL